MKKITTIFIMYLFYIAQITPLFADDIELYQSGDTGIRPNVSFLVDTSGSMNNRVTLEGSFYDHTVTYPGPFRNDRLYYYEFNETGSDIFDIDAIKDDLLNNTIHPNSFKCQSEMNNLNQRGYSVSKFLQWDPSIDFEVYYAFKGWREFHGVWRKLRATNDPNRYVDCQADLNQNHGLSSNDHKYMSHDENGSAYSSDKDKAVPKLLPAHIFRPGSPAFAGRGWWGLLSIDKVGSTNTVYTGNYLNYDFATQDNITRVPRLYYLGQIVSDAVAQYPGLNVSLSRFDGRLIGDFTIDFDWDFSTPLVQYEAPEGGMIALESLTSEGNALRFENTIKSWDAWGETPVTESLFEVSRYIKGQSVHYGDRTKVYATRDSFLGIGGTYYDFPSVAASRVNGSSSNSNYQTPMTESCQPNHVVILTDGAPVDDTNANAAIRNLISGIDFPSFPTGHILENRLDHSCSGEGGCIEEFAYYLANKDQFTSSEYPGTQTIITHTIAGFVSQSERDKGAVSLMEAVAKAGQGIYKDAESSDDVKDALNSIFASILTNSVSFTAPVVSVNAFNSLELSDELYYSVFKPSKNLSWEGNVKQYRMGTLNGKFAVLDAKDKAAIDAESGYFSDSALSIWSPEGAYPNGDGAEVVEGGILYHLPENRTVYTSISNSKNLPSLSSSNASKAQLGINSKDNNYHQALIKWARGQDGFDSDGDGDTSEAMKIMQDPLHSEPTIITYSKTKGTNGDKDRVDRTMFLGTNGGFLHAFDIDKESPTEHFSFIPKELLHNLELYRTGGGLLATKAYGIDGPITHWHKDVNGNKVVDNNEKVYVYFGLRRGGHSYYALDVSDRSDPKLLWEKHGPYPAGTPNRPAVSAGYETLGQTWSRLEPATVEWNGGDRVVLFASGGYDPLEDGDLGSGTHRTGPASRGQHNVGTSVYMIDALTGEVLWDAKKHSGAGSQMTSSFPAHTSPIDVTGDGYANIIYAADVGGRVWRFDINSSNSGSSDFATGRMLADLNNNGGSRRIYNEIDIIGSKESDQILLSIGSGNRSHPGTHGAQEADNYHFILKDSLTPPKSPILVTMSSLAQFPNASDYGWYIPLIQSGEKVLSRSNTVGDQILFSTFSPKIDTTPSCDAKPGYARTYKVDLSKGTLQFAELRSGGIPPMPMLIPPKREPEAPCTTPGVCADDGSKKSPEYSVLVGTEVVEFDDGIPSPYGNIFKNYWLEK